MKKLQSTIVFMICVGVASAGHAVLIKGKASLTGDQEVPPVDTAASGFAEVLFDTDTATLDMTASIDGISLGEITFPAGSGLAFGEAGPMHIHNAPPGVNGGIVVPFSLASYFSATATGISVNADDVPFDLALVPELLAGNLYLNVHTREFGGGEVRGVINVPEPGTLGLLGAGLLVVGLLRRRR